MARRREKVGERRRTGAVADEPEGRLRSASIALPLSVLSLDRAVPRLKARADRRIGRHGRICLIATERPIDWAGEF